MSRKPSRKRTALDRVELERKLAAERAKFGDDLTPEQTTKVVVAIKEIQRQLEAIK